MKKAVNFLKDFYMSNYHFGSTLSTRMFDSKWSGVFDALAGVGVTMLAATVTLNNAALVVAGVGALLAAPVSAAIAIATGTLFAGLGVMLVGLGTGLLAAAYKKSGLPWPKAACANAVDTVKHAVSVGMGGARRVFKSVKPDFTKASEPEAEAKAKPAPAPKHVHKPVF